jgi:hypothetical protein
MSESPRLEAGPRVAPIANNRKTINEIYTKCLSIINIEYELPITTNKGKPGQFLEDLLGIPHSSDCLDCLDGEVKAFPLKMLKNGTLVPKETIAVTMLNKDELSTNDFEHLNKSTPTKKITILVVDDDKIIRIATINALKKLGADKYQFF